MKCSDEILDEIERLASLLTKPDDICVLLDLPSEDFKRELKNDRSIIAKKYKKGKALTLLSVREQELKLAKLGSPLAVEMLHKFKAEQENNE